MYGQSAQLDIKEHGDGMMLVSVSEKQKLWKEWQQESTSKEKYLEPKNFTKTSNQAKCKAERKKFGNNMLQNDQKCDVFRTANMVKTNQDIAAGQHVRTDDGLLAVGDEDKNTSLKRQRLDHRLNQ